MDLGLSRDMFDSFMQYQSQVIDHFKRIQSDYGFTIVDANRSPEEINDELRERIEKMLRRG
jgi:dTMP kinase